MVHEILNHSMAAKMCTHDLFLMLHNAFHELYMQGYMGQSNELLSYYPKQLLW